jgi:hypothetical protein
MEHLLENYKLEHQHTSTSITAHMTFQYGLFSTVPDLFSGFGGT